MKPVFLIQKQYQISSTAPASLAPGKREMARSVNLPVMDLASPDVHTAATAVRQSCMEHGFFYVSNHRVDGALLNAVFAESRRFFEQPMEAKMALRRGSNNRGYTPPNAEKLDAASEYKGDLKESFDIGLDLNQWPPADLFPSLKDTMKLYQSVALAVGKKILSLIALSFDLNVEFFHKIGALNKCPSAYARLLHYPGKVNDSDRGNYGASAHSDFGMITLLVTEGTPGLQICREKDSQPQLWEDVPHIDGTIIVNIGDLLERWTNCLFRSTLHRVVPVGKERYSVAFFLHPDPDFVVRCLESCCNEANPPRFLPIRSGDYFEKRSSDTYK